MPVRTPYRPGSEVLAGFFLTATGRKDGLRRFPASREGFLASLAPLIAFPLVGALMLGASGAAAQAGIEFLATLCALLAPLVVSYEFARWWRRTDLWLRFATAFNWCEWAILLVVIVALAIALGARRATIAGPIAGCYALWLHWFIARHGLAISAWRAILLVICMGIASIVLGLGPLMLVHRSL